MNIDVEIITLEDGNNYMVTEELEINNIKYVYLTNEKNISDFCIRKINYINNDEYLVALDSREEFMMALNEFVNKFKTE